MSDNAETETTEPWEKKSERFEVRLPFSKKQAFVEACEEQGDTPSEAVRRFIHTYLRRAREDNMGMARRSLRHKARQHWAYGVAGVVAISTLSIVGPQGCATIKSQQTEAKRQALFATYDQDGSGELTLGEIATNDQSLYGVLDVDDSATLSFQEFVVQGRMQIIDSFRGEIKSPYIPEAHRRLVEFDLSDPDNLVLNTWKVDPEGGTVHDKMDRLVYRHYKTGKFTGLLADITLSSFDEKGVFGAITIDWSKTKKTYGFGLEKLSSAKLEGRPEIEFDENGDILITVDEVTAKIHD